MKIDTAATAGFLAIIILMTMGIAFVGVAPPGDSGVPQSTMAQTGRQETTYEGEGTSAPSETATSEPGPALSISHSYTDRIQLGENATVTIEVTDSHGSPVTDADVDVQSLGYAPGYFLEDTPVRTDADGAATVTWHFTVPHFEQEKRIRTLGGWPPAEIVTIYASTTVDGEEVEAMTTLRINPKCQDCHSSWRDTHTQVNNTQTFP